MRSTYAAYLAFGFSTCHCAAAIVPANSTGGFGAPNGGWTTMVAAWTFSSSETVSISTTGTIDLAPLQFGLNTGANGLTLAVDNLHIFPETYFPLEESAVELGNLILPRVEGTLVSNVGALMAAFIPAATAFHPSFVAADEDLVGMGVSSTSLFFVGTDAQFTSPGAGVLFVGVNDALSSNNFGAYDVTVTAIPSPATATVVVMLLLLPGRRRQCGRLAFPFA